MSVVPSAVRLRPARDDHADSHFIYHLSMDPSVLAVSTRGQFFSWPQHVEWYARRIYDSLIYIVEADKEAVGYVRWGQVEGRCEWEVSIAILPEMRGRGYAGRALRLSEDAVREQCADAAFTALVLPENMASIALFRSCGYVQAPPFMTEERMGKTHLRFVK